MRMDMRSVCMRGNHNFEAGNFFCQLQCDLMSDLRCEIFTGMEGLDHVVVHPTTGVFMEPLGVHELLQRKLRNTIDTANQQSAFVIRFRFLTAVVDHTVQSANSLRLPATDKVDD